jgi:hypothetical protein
METNISSVTDPPGNECSDAKHELLERGDCASNGWVCNLGLIHGNDHDQEADTNTSEPSSRPQHIHIRSPCLKGSTEKIDNTSDDNGHSSSKPVSRLLLSENRSNVGLDKKYLTGPAKPAPQKAPPVKNETTIPLKLIRILSWPLVRGLLTFEYWLDC